MIRVCGGTVKPPNSQPATREETAHPPGGDAEYDVALSFAGEDRAYVERIARLLQQRGIRVFYDEFMTADLWGEDLYVLLDEVYRKKSRFAVIFASEHYARKSWTSHERQSAQARALDESRAYLNTSTFGCFVPDEV
jgi:hypothetical protein